MLRGVYVHNLDMTVAPPMQVADKVEIPAMCGICRVMSGRQIRADSDPNHPISQGVRVATFRGGEISIL